MRVQINKTRGNNLAVHVYFLPGGFVGEGANRRNPVARDGNIRREGGAAHAITD